MRSKKTKVNLIITLWIAAAALLLISIFQMQHHANLMNDASIVRGGAQRAVKLELNHTPDDAIVERVDVLLSTLLKNEKESLIRWRLTRVFIDNLDAVQQKWEVMKEEFAVVRAGGSGEKLLQLSEEHFKLADTAVLSAQVRAETEFMANAVIASILFVSASIFMALLEHNSNKKIKRIFYTDHLTNTDNSHAFIEKATALLKNAPQNSYLLIYTNLGNFKFVNQSYGYETGDRLIQELGNALQAEYGEGELCAHTDADHFILLLKNKKQAPQKIQEAMNSAIRREKEISFSEIIFCNCGVYEIAEVGEPIQGMISKASLALTLGRRTNGVAYYDAYLLDKITRKNLLEQHMNSGIAKHEYKLFLQPKVLLTTGKVSGAEVLCRWDSAELGFLTPDEFIPLFEQNGFIGSLDFYMLEQICKQYKEVLKGNREAPLPASINFSRVTLLQNDFIERFSAVVKQYDVPHTALEIEVTESAFITDEDTVIRLLKELKALGFCIAMDDFGLGYSSLNLLRKLPIDILKMDKGFLQEGTQEERTRCIIACIVQMARSLDIRVVCEGVETINQVEFLQQIGCDIAQGFYYSKPIPIEQFKKKYV